MRRLMWIFIEGQCANLQSVGDGDLSPLSVGRVCDFQQVRFGEIVSS